MGTRQLSTEQYCVLFSKVSVLYKYAYLTEQYAVLFSKVSVLAKYAYLTWLTNVSQGDDDHSHLSACPCKAAGSPGPYTGPGCRLASGPRKKSPTAIFLVGLTYREGGRAFRRTVWPKFLRNFGYKFRPKSAEIW